MKAKINWKGIVKKNVEGITAFTLRMLDHDGVINSKFVYEVVKEKKGIVLQRPKKIRGKYINGGIRIPGEITNSFCTLYEIGYFANAIVLSGVVSFLPIEEYKKYKRKGCLIKKIKKDILTLSNKEIKQAIQKPQIPIISWLTDDVETYRFNKEMLWGVKDSKKIIGKITKKELGKDDSKRFYNDLWIDKDKVATDIAIKNAANMSQAKMIQYYLALEEFFKKLDIDLSSVPLYFFSCPYHELMELGPNHEFLEFLIEMHSPENLKMFSKVTGQDNPVLIKIPCPKCGQSSKKVLNGRIKGKDKRTVRLICSKSEKSFTNEHGLDTKKVCGCGHTWEFRIPETPQELYKFFKEKSFSLHIALTNLLQVFRRTAISPVAHVICDLNIYYDKKGDIKIFSPFPQGYGSSAHLFTSVMGVQLAFLKGLLAKDFFKRAKKNKWIVDKPFMIFAHQSPSNLYDPSEIYEDILKKLNIKTGPQDSGIFKVLKNGMVHEEIFNRSVDLTYYPAKKMLNDVRGLTISTSQKTGL